MRALFFLYLLFAFAVAGTADYTTQVERDNGCASESGLFSSSDALFQEGNNGR